MLIKLLAEILIMTFLSDYPAGWNEPPPPPVNSKPKSKLAKTTTTPAITAPLMMMNPSEPQGMAPPPSGSGGYPGYDTQYGAPAPPPTAGV